MTDTFTREQVENLLVRLGYDRGWQIDAELSRMQSGVVKVGDYVYITEEINNEWVGIGKVERVSGPCTTVRMLTGQFKGSMGGFSYVMVIENQRAIEAKLADINQRREHINRLQKYLGKAETALESFALTVRWTK